MIAPFIQLIKKAWTKRTVDNKEMHLISEPRAQTQDRSVRDDGDPGTGGVGGLPADGAQAAVVLDRRRAGAARAAQAHPAPLSAAAPPLQTEQNRRPGQLSTLITHA